MLSWGGFWNLFDKSIAHLLFKVVYVCMVYELKNWMPFILIWCVHTTPPQMQKKYCFKSVVEKRGWDKSIKIKRLHYRWNERIFTRHNNRMQL